MPQPIDEIAPLIPEEFLPMHMTATEVNDLFASCLPKLRRATRRMLRNPQDSEDALQDGLLLAFRKLNQFEGRSSFATWVHSIVRNASRMHYRRTAARQAVPFEPEITDREPHLLDSGFVELRPSPEEICIQKERSDILRKTTQELPEKYHGAIKYFHLEGLGEVETARRLRLTPSALKSQLHRSRQILTSKIRKSYVPKSLRASKIYRRVSCRSCTARVENYLTRRGSGGAKFRKRVASVLGPDRNSWDE